MAHEADLTWSLLVVPPFCQATFARFRGDVMSTVERHPHEQTATPVIRYEYVQAIFGAAIDVPRESLDAIRRLPYVKAVVPDRVVTAYAAGDAKPTAAAIDAAARVNASSLATRGDGIRIGVIDTGIDYTHPALGGAFGPGHKVAGGWDFANNDGDPKDDAGHGTHVAGIIAADSPEIAGVAPGATLYAYKVLSAQGSGLQSNVIAAIERSIDPNQDGNPSDHLDVINLSLGGPGTADDLVSHAVDNATAAGVIVVVAAGNAGRPDSIGSPGRARSGTHRCRTRGHGDDVRRRRRHQLRTRQREGRHVRGDAQRHAHESRGGRAHVRRRRDECSGGSNVHRHAGNAAARGG